MLNIQEMMNNFWSHSCYAWCLTKYFSAMKDEITKEDLQGMCGHILYGWRQGFIEDDCYVAKPIEYIKLLTNQAPRDIYKISITSLAELPEGTWIVEYKKKPTDKASHFVIANKEKVLFDPSGDSQTVKVGKPFSYRKFIY